MTAADWLEFIPFIAAEEDLPQCAVDGLTVEAIVGAACAG